MLTYRATLDVPVSTVARVSRWLPAHRRRIDIRPWQRAATCWTQAIGGAAPWLKDDTDMALLARDAGVSPATGYRYLHEAIDVIAAHLPDLPDVLAAGHEAGWACLCLDGTLIETTRCAAKSGSGHDIWYSGKHHSHGGNIQVLTDPTGFPVWTSPVEPGSTHDITAARARALPALYAAAANGLPTLADKGYNDPAPASMSPSKEPTWPPTTRPPTCSSPAFAPPPNAPTPSSNPAGRPSAASPCVPTASATSSPPSSSRPCTAGAGENTSLFGGERHDLGYSLED